MAKLLTLLFGFPFGDIKLAQQMRQFQTSRKMATLATSWPQSSGISRSELFTVQSGALSLVCLLITLLGGLYTGHFLPDQNFNSILNYLCISGFLGWSLGRLAIALSSRFRLFTMRRRVGAVICLFVGLVGLTLGWWVVYSFSAGILWGTTSIVYWGTMSIVYFGTTLLFFTIGVLMWYFMNFLISTARA